MSQQGRLEDQESALDTLTGNTGGAVGPDGLGNINVIGAAPYTVSGNPGTFTLTITDDGTVATTFTADTGAATPSANNLDILGTAAQGVSTSGATDTITITVADATTTQKGVLETSTGAESIAGSASDVAVVPSSLGAKLGAQTADGIAFGTGTTAAIGWTTGLTDGQLAIGSSAGVPAAGNITSTGGTITVTNGANTINLETDSSIASSFPTDSGTAVPAAGALTIDGGTGINTSGAGSTVTVNLDSPVIVDNGGTGATTLTGVLTGNGTSPVTANAVTQYTVLLGGASNAVNEVSGVGTSGQVLTSNGAAMDPTWQDAGGGDVSGPVSSTDNALARWNGTGGDTLQDSTVIVTDNGEMTNASQPSFLGVLNATDSNVTGNGTTYSLGTNTAMTEIFDQNGDYDPGGAGAATFTAPVTGRYFISMHVRYNSTTGGNDMIENMVTSNRTYQDRYNPPSLATQSRLLSAVCDMDAADTCTWEVFMNGVGADTVDLISSNTQTNVCGALIC